MTKICAICGEDCSERPRVRDRAGAYYCKSCDEARAGVVPATDRPHSASLSATGVVLAEDIRLDAEPTPEPPPEEPPDTPADEADDAEVYAIADPVAAAAKACPVCLLKMAADSVICAHCGYDERRGIQSSSLVEGTKARDGRRQLPCAHCGYDLTGLHAPRCPECGTLVGTTRRERIDRKVSEDVVRREYLKPVVMFAVGVAGMFLILLLRGSPDLILYHLLSYAIAVPVGVTVLWFCCLAWIGFNAPFHLNALRLAGIYALTDLGGMISFMLPFWLVWYFAVLVLYIWMLAEMMDMDLVDALIVAILTFFARMALGLLVASWLA